MKTKSPFISEVILWGFTACFLSVLSSCTLRHNGAQPPQKIEVTGSAEMEFVPDEIYMTFTLKEYLNSAKQKVKLENIKTDFLSLCKKSEIPDSCISIASYTGNDRWDYYWYKRKKTEPDFMASISYAIKVDSPDKLDKIVNGLNEDGLDNFYISKTSHSKIEEFRKEIKTKALIASKTKAEYLAKSIGQDIGEALLIQELEDSYRSYYSNIYSNEAVSQTTMSMESNTASSTPGFQKMKLRYEMKVVFELK